MNNFKDDLKFSHEAEDLDMWHRIYNQAFPNFLSMTSTREDGQMQQLGVDRTIVTSSGKAVYIDEKARRKDYGDIILEYISNDKKMTKGWVEKPLFCDYIAYAILPSDMCYLLPVHQLQSVWLENKNEWLKTFEIVPADNKFYTTLSCAVPIKVLFGALGKALRINYSGQKAA